MKSKILLWGSAFALLFALGSCKSKESAYKAAYERAKPREMQDVREVSTTVKSTPVVKPTPEPSPEVQMYKTKNVTTNEGSGLKRYNIVIGSFRYKTNADNLNEDMRNQGFKSFIIQNQQGFYQVIVAAFDNKSDAIETRNTLKRDYHPDFKDIWILER